VIIVEGYMDFIMPFQSGVRNIVASLGTALTVEQIRAIRRYAENIIMLFDSDQAGESAMVRSLDLLIEEDLQVRVATLDKGSDPDSFIRKHGVEKFKERVGAAQSLFEFKLSSLLSKYGDDTIENRTKVAEEMLSIINKFGSAIIKTEYVKRLSEVLNISQQALMQELEKNRQSNGRSISRRQEIVGSEKLKKQDQIHPVEREILKLMLDEKKFVVLTKETVDIADFHSDFVREIVAKIYELSDQGKETSLSALISSFDDQRFIKLISGLMASENSLIGDKRRIHQDCIKRLKKDSVKNKKKKIRGQMEIANREGNQLRLEELAKEFNQLIKG
ncbi:MAG: toprim domain-containing protein, partial [Candidatus Heimdallarchaeota archaeon]|nr:toprim domain-containing protein [Candidatus Heimdallarchaeota archaeon]